MRSGTRLELSNLNDDTIAHEFVDLYATLQNDSLL